jgi:hypothetical protein
LVINEIMKLSGLKCGSVYICAETTLSKILIRLLLFNHHDLLA